MLLAKEKYDYYHLEEVFPGGGARPKRRKRQARKVLNERSLYVWLVLIFFVAGLFVVSRYAQLAVSGYQLVKMKKQLSALQAEHDQLLLTVERLQSLDHIEKVATEKLGMQKPDLVAGVELLPEEPTKDKAATGTTGGADEQRVASAEEKKQRSPVLQAFIDLFQSLKGESSWKAEAHQAP